MTKKRLLIILDKSIYSHLKNKGYKVSTFINQLLKVSLFKGAYDYLEQENNNSDLNPYKAKIGSSNLSRTTLIYLIF